MQFKKQICLFLAFFVLVSNSGLAFNVHFCEGKIASVSSVFSKEEVCDPTDSKQAKQMPVEKEKLCCAKLDVSHKKCCSDKKVDLKNKTEKMVFKTVSFELDAVYFAESLSAKICAPVLTTLTTAPLTYCCDANAPPFYQLYCQFTLFG